MIDAARRKLLGLLGMAPFAGGVFSMSAASATGTDTRPGSGNRSICDSRSDLA